MNLNGIIIGVAAFFCIGIFHPIVIKCEYYFSWRVWPVFLVAGILCLIGSMMIENTMLSSVVGVLGCSCLWSILELRQQARRVEKGWFPANPKRKR